MARADQKSLEFATLYFREALHAVKFSFPSPGLHKLFAGQACNMDVAGMVCLSVVASSSN